MAWIEPFILPGKYCSLEPLSHDHHNALVAAVKDGELWNLWVARVPSLQQMQQEIFHRTGSKKWCGGNQVTSEKTMGTESGLCSRLKWYYHRIV